MSLLQWVKNGFGLGRRRTSETIPLSPETSGTFEGRPELKFPEVSKDAYAGLIAAKKRHEEASLLAMQELLRELDAAGYSLSSMNGVGTFVAYKDGQREILSLAKGWKTNITVAAKGSNSAVSISL